MAHEAKEARQLLSPGRRPWQISRTLSETGELKRAALDEMSGTFNPGVTFVT